MESTTTGSEPVREGPDRSALAIAAVLLGLLVGFGAYLWMLASPDVPDFGDAAHVLPVPAEIPEFDLVDQHGETFDRSSLEGHWSLLFFGYTYCPDVCPMTLQSLARVRELMDREGGAGADTRMVFVSVDPARDSVARLAEYVAFFFPELVGATGDAREIDRLTGAVGAFHREAEGERPDEYLVDHSSSLYLVDPQARLHAVLHEPRDPREFVNLLRKVEAFERSS